MTVEELLHKLNGVEWNDFEAKEAKFDVPKSVWETVSAFSNSSGGWIVLGIKEKKSEVIFDLPINANQRQSTPNGVNDAEKSLKSQVLTLIGANNRITISALAAATNQSKRTIDRVIEDLKRNNQLSRIGSTRGGKWEIPETDKK